MRIVTKPEASPDRIVIYGGPKTAKTRLATSLPWGPKWGEQAVYVAFDPGAASLRSVLSENRKHLIVVDPKPEQGKYDPLHEAVKIATYDWRKEGAGTIIFDTISELSRQLLMAYAALGNYAKEQITYGKPGTPEFHAHPTMGDYSAAQSSTCEHITNHLFAQPLHLIVVCWEEWSEPKNANECVGGPATVGQATIKTYAGRFDTVIRTEARKRGEPGKPKTVEFMARTQPHGPWLVGIRNPGTNLPDCVLNEDPINFWRAYDALAL